MSLNVVLRLIVLPQAPADFAAGHGFSIGSRTRYNPRIDYPYSSPGRSMSETVISPFDIPVGYEHVEFTADLCIKCNICTSACPVAPVTDLFPGPKTVGPQAQRFRMNGERGAESPDASVDYCSGCGICTMVCPHGVKIMEMNVRAREALYDGDIPLRNRILGRSELMGKLGHRFAPLLNFGASIRPARVIAEKVIGIHRDAPLPKWSFTPFREWFRRHKPQAAAPYRGQVAYFHACAGNYFDTTVSKAAVMVLAHNGFDVVLPEQNCCGLPMQSNGEFEAAKACGRSNIDKLAPYARLGIPVVGASTSCTLSLKSDYREILQIDHPDRDRVARNTYDLSEFLLMLHQRGELRTDFHALPFDELLYHAPCQQKAHHMGQPALDLFALIPGLRVRLADAACCGIAGTYGLKREKYTIGMDVGEPLFAQVRAAGTDKPTICDSETCRWQITHATGAESIHPVQVLAAAYGIVEMSA
ncbi:MAG: anaerobic glycerol-3-phosphate dehydrogenase subunit C [bacterium]|nr:anaerobic glycerol-3-phosphate dehydrogenase subunit C [bacterium]